MPRRRPQPKVPPYLILPAVLATAVLTAWAMWSPEMGSPFSMDGEYEGGEHGMGAGSGMGPGAGGPAMQGGMPVGMPQAGMMGGLPAQQGMLQPTAARTGAPTIVWGARRPHPDRGACANCHTVVQRNGQPLPTIQSFSSMPHEFRGVCSNCHQVQVGGRRR